MSISSRRRVGFTLVELLVVITIIGMLVALLLPAVNAVRNRARQTQCTNNLKQLALAAVNYESSKGVLPGYSQFVKRSTPTGGDPSKTYYIGATVLQGTLTVQSVTSNQWEVSWATMLLPKIERQDYWDQLVDGNMTTPAANLQILPIEVFKCPADTEVVARRDLAGLSYSANTGAWDRDQSGNVLTGQTNKGDVAANGVFFNVAEGGPQTRLNMKDGAGMTIMLSENVHKNYDDPNYPFTWLAGTEQQLGIVWVVPPDSAVGQDPVPTTGNAINQQESINVVGDDANNVYSPTTPRFARPASSHGDGALVAFCDGQVRWLRRDIDYITYQRLMTSEGRYCEDPTSWVGRKQDPPAGKSIYKFRFAPPLAEKDFQ